MSFETSSHAFVMAKRASLLAAALVSLSTAVAACTGLPSHSTLSAVLTSSVAATGGPLNGGLELNMWATLVDREGTVCAVARTGSDPGDQWPGSRVISAQKANTANAFSLPGLALSTANLFSAVQPGGSLFGLQFSNPVDPAVAYAGPTFKHGKPGDPMVGKKIGGVNVFGGGLPLYNAAGDIVGAVGVSGDTSCADHNIAWRVREGLGLDNVPGGVNVNGNDGIIYDIQNGASTSGFGHPTCLGSEPDVALQIGAGTVAGG